MNKKAKALYIHIPFCQSICNYCDFPKLQYFRNFAEKYLIKLNEELESYKISHQLDTIYIGGGTPTCLDDDLLEQLLWMLKPYSFGIKEYTVEANPESLTENKIRMLKAYGVNRLSIGVESTDDKILKSLNRQHTYQDVKTAIITAQKWGFDNLNVDLILGVPHASKVQLKKDLDNILSLDIQHISCYSLIIEPHTIISLQNIKPHSDNFERELYDIVEETLSQKGFVHYEISNWSKEGFESQHNLTYWRDEPYYGIGMGASGYINNTRYANTKSLTKYIDGVRTAEKETVTPDDDEEYFIMLSLRTKDGINLKEFEKRFHFSFMSKYKEKCQPYIEQGFLILLNDKLSPSYEGMMIADQIVLNLLS